MTITLFAGVMLGLIAFSILAGLAWSRFIGPLKEFDDHVLEEPQEARSDVDFNKAIAHLKASSDEVVDVTPVEAEWSPADPSFWKGALKSTDPTEDIPGTCVAEQPRPTAEPIDFEIYLRARQARAAKRQAEWDDAEEFWVLPAGGEWTEAQIEAVARLIDAEEVKS